MQIQMKGTQDVLREQAKLDNSLKNENWENVQEYAGGCRVVYGCQDGKLYAYGVQDDISEIIAECRRVREEEAANPNAYKWLGVRKWHMPKILELELMSRGYPIEQMIRENELSELDKLFDTEFKEFKLTNLMLSPMNRKARRAAKAK